MNDFVSDRAERIYSQFLSRASRDDEYHDWAGYRAELTGFILRNVSPGSSLLILGAGRCNDLDLTKLSEHCRSIALSDYQMHACEKALDTYGLSPSEHLKLVESDYVGITDRDYLEYTELLLSVMQRLEEDGGGSLEEIAGAELNDLRKGLERIYRDNERCRCDLGVKAYDNAVIVGVHSQLNNSFQGLFQYARKEVEDRSGQLPLAEELNREVFEITRKHTSRLVDRFNEAAFTAVRSGVIYGYEKSIIYTPEGAMEPVIGTVDGARQAAEAISDFITEDHMTCLWPLSRRRKIRFEMSISYFRAAFMDLT